MQTSKRTKVPTLRTSGLLAMLVGTLFFLTSIPLRLTAAPFEFKNNDVIAFLGGADVSSAQKNGYLESLLTAGITATNIHFRNFGWEGDTVFEQPRDFNFPSLKEHLKKAGVTMLFLQFGRMESLQGGSAVPEFTAAYEKMIRDFSEITPRILLITPPPFEAGGGNLPNLQNRNKDLAKYVAGIQNLAQKLQLPIIDLFSLSSSGTHHLTEDGLQLSNHGHAALARLIARNLGFNAAVEKAGDLTDQGQWSNPACEKVRVAIVEKNKLWFNYWRPQNWAFLGGDRTEQPSSRDHRDPKIRWFPTEMEKYKALIEQKEAEIQTLAQQLR
jgi:lysophospholipase L1-like esterase